MRSLKRIIAIALVCATLAVCACGCGVKSKPLLELDKSEISVNLFQLYLSRMKGTLCSADYFGTKAKQDSFWDTIVDAYEKTTYNTLYTDMVLDTAKSYLAAIALFEERGLELPDSYIEEIDEELESLIENVADGSKTALNTILSEFGANYDVLREAYIIEAKIAYLREDLFGINGSKVAPTLIEEYYQDNYARFKQVFLYTYEYVYETDENGDNIYYKEDGKISYDTSKELMRDKDGNTVTDKNGDRIYVYVDEKGKERIAYDRTKGEREMLIGEDGDPVIVDLEGDDLKLLVEKANGILETVKEGDTIGFDLLVDEYNEEEGSEKYPNGYYVTENTQYASAEVIETLFDLKVGEYKMVKSDYGLHIIMRYELEKAAYTLEEYTDLFIANSTGTYIFMGDLMSKMLADYVSSYKEKVTVDETLLDGIDMKSVGVNFNY
jgi:hypothetical protein